MTNITTTDHSTHSSFQMSRESATDALQVRPTIVSQNQDNIPEVARYNVSEDRAGKEGTFSARTAHSGRSLAPSEITPKSIVNIDGMEMEARIAESLGYLKLSERGTYQDAEKVQEAAPADTTESEMVQPEPLDDESEKMLGEWMNTPGAKQHLVSATMQFVNEGEIDQSTINALASHFGCEPSELNPRMEKLQAAFEKQAADVVTKETGIDARTFFEIAEQVAPEKFREAKRTHAMSGTTGGYKDAADAVMAHAVKEAVHGRGPLSRMTEREDVSIRNGTLVVHLETGETIPFFVAWRQGYASFGSK